MTNQFCRGLHNERHSIIIYSLIVIYVTFATYAFMVVMDDDESEEEDASNPYLSSEETCGRNISMFSTYRCSQIHNREDH